MISPAASKRRYNSLLLLQLSTYFELWDNLEHTKMRKKTTLKLPGNETWYQHWYWTYAVQRKVSCQDLTKTSILILHTISILAWSCQNHNSDLTYCTFALLWPHVLCGLICAANIRTLNAYRCISTHCRRWRMYYYWLEVYRKRPSWWNFANKLLFFRSRITLMLPVVEI